jgi:tripartite ATP-independent transporter DctP family solute receptor
MKLIISGYRAVFLLLLAVITLTVMGCSEQDKVVRLKLAHTLDPQHTVHKAMVLMDERLKELSGGTMAIDIYPSGQLGSERELIELLQIGSLSMTKVSASPLEGFVPEMKIFNIPYLFRDAGHVQRVLDSSIGQQLLETPTAVRLLGLGYYDAGSRSFYSTKKPVETPDDLDSMKIRVQESQTAMEMVSSLGGSPTPVAWGELYTALQQGVVDGAENNPPSFYLSHHYEVARYYTLDEHSAVPDILLISQYVWSQLNPQQRIWLRQAVKESVAYQREQWRIDTEYALAEVTKAGVTVIRPDKTLFRDKVQLMLKSYEGTPIGAVIQQIQEYP